jgi:hypothetical protein
MRWWNVVVLALVSVAAGVGMLAWHERQPAEDPVARFLGQHWNKPLPSQGPPPPAFSTQEASLDPADCGQCHAEQHADWSGSLHSHTMGPGILWQARALPPAEIAKCLDCHAPLAEQKALLARELDWPGAPQTDPPDYVAPDLHRQGLVCAACHVRAHTRYGPPAGEDKPAGDTFGLPHGGFVESTAFGDSRFCATCHQFPDDGPSLNGKLLENTLKEWQVSRHAQEGRQCQSCHMPGRRHLWRGIHDPAMVREALSTELALETLDDGRLRVQALVRNSGAGHYFPTYLVPRVWLRLVLIDPDGRDRTLLAEQVVARDVDVWLREERSDTRIAPDEARQLGAEIGPPPGPGWAVELRVDVAPREHYERMFTTVLRNNAADLDAEALRLLEQALTEAQATRFTALRERRPLPAIAN